MDANGLDLCGADLIGFDYMSLIKGFKGGDDKGQQQMQQQMQQAQQVQQAQAQMQRQLDEEKARRQQQQTIMYAVGGAGVVGLIVYLLAGRR